VVYADQSNPSEPKATMNFVAVWNIKELNAMRSDGLLGLSPRVIESNDG